MCIEHQFYGTITKLIRSFILNLNNKYKIHIGGSADFVAFPLPNRGCATNSEQPVVNNFNVSKNSSHLSRHSTTFYSATVYRQCFCYLMNHRIYGKNICGKFPAFYMFNTQRCHYLAIHRVGESEHKGESNICRAFTQPVLFVSKQSPILAWNNNMS